MRTALFLAPLLLSATAAGAQPAPAPSLPPQLAEPATVDRLADAMQAVSKAFLNLPVGDVQAALEGRQPSAADRRATVGSETHMSDRVLRARIAATKPMIEQSMKAVNDALPALLQGLAQAQQSLDRAAANMPDPNYPKR
jgi:hypothetical protein